jgi:hypothetical protein
MEQTIEGERWGLFQGNTRPVANRTCLVSASVAKSGDCRFPLGQHHQLSEQDLPQAKEFIQPCQRFRDSALGLKIYQHRCQRMYLLVYLFDGLED